MQTMNRVILLKPGASMMPLAHGLVFSCSGAVIVIWHGWEGWIFAAIGLLCIIVQFLEFASRDKRGAYRSVSVDETGIGFGKKDFAWANMDAVRLSSDFVSIRLKKHKYPILLSWAAGEDQIASVMDICSANDIPCDIPEKTADEFDGLRKNLFTAFVSYALYYFGLILGILSLDIFKTFFGIPAVIVLFALTAMCIWFAVRIERAFQQTLDNSFYSASKKVFFICMLCLNIGITFRWIYGPAETDDVIRGIATFLLLSPFFIINITSLSRMNR